MRNQRPLAVAGLVLMAITAAVADAVLQGRRAQRRFDDLRQLAGSFLFEFHDAIANLQGATPARELVLKRALQYLDSLSREAAHDTDLKMEVAEGYLRVGSAQGLYFESNLGKVEEARAAFTKSIALFEELRAARPDDLQAVTGLGRAMLSLNTLNRQDVAVALAVNQRVAAMLEEFGRRKPLAARAQLVLGQAYFGIAEAADGPGAQRRIHPAADEIDRSAARDGEAAPGRCRGTAIPGTVGETPGISLHHKAA